MIRQTTAPPGSSEHIGPGFAEMSESFEMAAERQTSQGSKSSEKRVVTLAMQNRPESFLQPEGNTPAAPPPRKVGAWTEMFLFCFFIATRALHPAFIDNAKELVIIDGKEKLMAPYAKVTPCIGCQVVSLIVGQVMALSIGGVEEWRSIWRPAPLKVFGCIGAMYAVGDIMEVLAISKVSGDAYQVLLQSKLMITAMMMWYFKGTKTTRLQWVILAVVMCSMSVYSTSAGTTTKEIDPKYYDMTVESYVEMMAGKAAQDTGVDAEYMAGISLVVVKVIISCLCGVLADKYMKEFKNEPIYVQIVQFKLAWLPMLLLYTFFDGETWTGGGPLEGWNGNAYAVLGSFTVKDWAGLYLLAILDSVLKNIGEAASVLATFMLSIYVFQKSAFELDAFLMVLVVTLAVVSYIDSKAVVDKANKYDEALCE